MKKYSMMTAMALVLGLAAAPAMAADDWDAWDANEDGILDNEEFGTGFGDAGIYDLWDSDGDGALTEDEFNAGVFGGYDEDDSGALEEPEYGDLGDDMGDGGFFDV